VVWVTPLHTTQLDRGPLAAGKTNPRWYARTTCTPHRGTPAECELRSGCSLGVDPSSPVRTVHATPSPLRPRSAPPSVSRSAPRSTLLHLAPAPSRSPRSSRLTQINPVAASAAFWVNDSLSAGRARSLMPAMTSAHFARGAQKKIVLLLGSHQWGGEGEISG
jgi:hypothetical protein